MIDIILRATLTAAVAQGTPLLLTALGEIMNQRAGVLNLGLDGMMLFGAVTAFISLIASGSLFVAVLVGGVCAALLALIHAFLSVTCRVHQVICGLALNIFAAGFSAFVGKDYNGIAAPKVLENIRIPLLADIPYLGEIFFNQNLLVYLSYALVIVLSFVMFRTQIGLKMRACGENPSAAYSTGVNVNRTRYIYVMIGGFLGNGSPHAIIDALVESGVKDLTLIVNDTAYPDKGCGRLIAGKQVRKVIVSHIGTNPCTSEQMNSGELEIEFCPQGTLAERVRSGGAGLGGVLTPVGLGTIVAEGKQIINVDGKDYLLEKPLRADVALLGASLADRSGNLVYKGTSQNFNPLMATAADLVIAEVRELVETGAIAPEAVRTPGIFVDYMVAPAK